MENLLFVTILIQWQDYLIKHLFWDTSNDQCVNIAYMGDERIKLPKTVPLSPIIHRLESVSRHMCCHCINVTGPEHNDVKIDYDMFIPCFMELYTTYIAEDRAPLEINISGENRRKLESYYTFFLDNPDVDQVMKNYRENSAFEVPPTTPKSPMSGNSATIVMAEIVETKRSGDDNPDHENGINVEKKPQNESSILNQELFWHLWYDLALACNEVFDMLMPSLVQCYKQMEQ